MKKLASLQSVNMKEPRNYSMDIMYFDIKLSYIGSNNFLDSSFFFIFSSFLAAAIACSQK